MNTRASRRTRAAAQGSAGYGQPGSGGGSGWRPLAPPADHSSPQATTSTAVGDDLDLFLHFYRADNATGDKGDDDLRWFEGVVRG